LARIIAEGLNEHPVEPKFPGVAKLFDAQSHAFVTGFRFGTIRAEERAPPREA